MKKASIISILFYLGFSTLNAQVSNADSSVYIPMIKAGYGYFISSGDLASRFGNNSALCVSVDFKMKNYWTVGLAGSYLFGNKIKEQLFDSIAKENVIINEGGDIADVRLYERGFTISSLAGRMFFLNHKQPNSGMVACVGIGFIQHKIRIEVIGNDVPQLARNYKKGYDRLTNGFLLTENLGYLYLSNNRLLNFYAGLECMQGFTQSRRSFDFDKMKRDERKRLDILYGARIAWILPLYKKTPKEFYNY